MTIAIGNDHAGYALKVKLMEMLKDKYEFTRSMAVIPRNATIIQMLLKQLQMRL